MKIRDTGLYIAEKYMTMARDAYLSGLSRIGREIYLQHAEHYNRIIMAYREQQISQGGADPGAMARPRPSGLNFYDTLSTAMTTARTTATSATRQPNPVRHRQPQPQQPPLTTNLATKTGRIGLMHERQNRDPQRRGDRQHRGDRPDSGERPDRGGGPTAAKGPTRRKA